MVVPLTQFTGMLDATEDAPIPPTPVVIHGSGHSFRRSRDEKIWYDSLDAFLAEHNPADQLDSSGQWTPPLDPREAGRFTPLNLPSSDDQSDESTGPEPSEGG